MVVKNSEDRFSNTLPKYSPPKDKYKELTKPPIVNHTPATKLEDQKQEIKILELLEQAKALSQVSASIVKLETDKGVSAVSKKRLTTLETKQLPKPTFCEAHIIEDPAEFIKTTRSMNISDKGAMNLLRANGGNEYLSRGMLPAQAWDLLRKDKLNSLSRPPGKEFDRVKKVEGNGYVAGLPPKIKDYWEK